jgi:hypothetical protein
LADPSAASTRSDNSDDDDEYIVYNKDDFSRHNRGEDFKDDIEDTSARDDDYIVYNPGGIRNDCAFSCATRETADNP